ncbi:MAG: DUF4388 domain-containing protein [Polyangiaceae bacterium]
MHRAAERAEEAIIHLGVLSEADLLKFLSAHHKTRFVTTEKLAKSDIDRATLQLLPRKFAESAGLFPVLFDAATSTLSVVTADPDNLQALSEAQTVSSARAVKAFVGRPAAVKAAIQKHYGGDIHAFALLDRQAHAQFQAMLDVYDRNLVSESSMAAALTKEGYASSSRERVLSKEELSNPNMKRLAESSVDDVVELVNVFVSLLENERPDLRGHSAHVSRFVKQICDRINLEGQVASAAVLAAQLHDVGKTGTYHLTPLNCSEYEGHRVAAQKSYTAPLRLLERVPLPEETTLALKHMYERFDGNGFPDGIVGKDIPLVARILAVCDTYADVTQNPRNPFRKVLTPAEACDALVKYRETVFDPNIVDLLRHVVLGQDLRAKLLSNRYTALIVDADPEETTVLELRMIEQGFDVSVARSADQAMRLLQEKEIDIVISEIDLPGIDGLTLLSEARKYDFGKDIPWVVHTRRQGRGEPEKAFELGVLDYVPKPSTTSILVAKLKALLDQRMVTRGARGIAGSLKELGLPDMVQALAQGRKSGNLKIRSRGDAGEIHLVEGAVVNALWGQVRGEDAFYQMLRLTEGEFHLDPSFKATARVIHQTSESLLLEAMRRIDEGISA